MIVAPIGNIFDPNGSNIKDIVLYNDVLYTATSQPAFRAYSADSLGISVSQTVNVVGSPSGICILTSASGAIVSSTTSQVDIVELSSGYRTGIVTNAAPTFLASASNQVDGNPSTGYAVATKSATGSVTLINGNALTCSSLTVSTLSGVNATCVRVKDSNFLIGTSDGKVHEINTSGTVIKSLTLPTSNQVAALTTYRITSISYYNGLALIADTAGVIRLYDWTQAAPALLDNYFKSNWDFNQVSTLSSSASGTCYLTGNRAVENTDQAVQEIYFGGGEILVNDIFYTNRFSGYTGATVDPVYGKMAIFDTNSTTTGTPIKVFNVTGLTTLNVTTRIQDPAGTGVVGRIIRIRDMGPGKSFIETDINIGAAQTNVVCTNGHSYIEIAIEAGTPNRYDIREFLA